MKLPRLGDPKTYKDGDLEITIASQFDMMPTWAQYACFLIWVPFLVAAIWLVLQ